MRINNLDTQFATCHVPCLSLACSVTSLDPLLLVLGIPHLSEQVVAGQPLVAPDDPSPARQLSSCLAAALPQLQRQLMHLLAPGDYQVGRQLLTWCGILHAACSRTLVVVGVIQPDTGCCGRSSWQLWGRPASCRSKVAVRVRSLVMHCCHCNSGS